jgi:hypothetical protein
MNHRNLLVLAGAVLLASSPGVYAEAERDSRSAAATSETVRTVHGFPPWSVNLGTGLAIYNGSTGWALGVGSLYQVTDAPLFVGADLGLNFWSFSAVMGTTSYGATGVQLLPTAVYALRQEAVRGLHPYFGLSIGPHLYSESRTVAGVTTTNTQAFFEVLFRVGANYTLSQTVALQVEPKFGLLNGNFIFLPQVSAVIAL